MGSKGIEEKVAYRRKFLLIFNFRLQIARINASMQEIKGRTLMMAAAVEEG